MKLRDHPLMTRKSGIKLWPPPWTSSMQDKPHWPHGEVGTLQRVWMHPRLGTCLFLFIEYDGITYTGSMYFDDPRFCIDVDGRGDRGCGRIVYDLMNYRSEHSLTQKYRRYRET